MITYLKRGKIKIREGLWETNSSSVHSLVIKKEMPAELPKEVYFGLGTYEWREKWYSSVEEKCKYLHTAIYCRYFVFEEDKNKYREYKKKISDILKDNGIESTWFDISKIDDEWDYHIDHSDELEDFIFYVIEDPNLLIEWLFNKDSILVTDNDNCEMEATEKVRELYDDKEDYMVYTKGN